MGEKEIIDLGLILKVVRRKFDNLFNRPANYMMMLFPSPTDGNDYNYHHFRIEFVSVERDGEKDKYRAGVETGLNVWTNDISPEKTAEKFKKI
jgi:galactose-1-phosphate uridylyltransferase